MAKETESLSPTVLVTRWIFLSFRMIEDDDAADEHDADGNDSDGHDITHQAANYYGLTLTNISFALNIHSYYKLGL